MVFSPFAAQAQSPGYLLPPGWNNHWQTVKAKARAGQGQANMAIIGDSISAGQSSGTVTDCLLYGYPGRLLALLAPSLGAWADGYTLAGVAPGNLVSPSGPYTIGAASSAAVDAGISQTWGPAANGTNWLTIAVNRHPVTNAIPQSIDLFTVDFNTNTWTYNVDSTGAVNVTPLTWGGSGITGQGRLRRTSITLAGNTTHSILISQTGANALAFVGHVTYYGTNGLGFMRNGMPGFKGIDFATGGGSTASSTGSNSLTPDHIKPWSGVQDAFNISGSTFPWGPDLAIISVGGNDVTNMTSLEAYRNSVARMINALRRGNPATSADLGVSIILLGIPASSPYGDNPTADNVGGTFWHRYKNVFVDMAQSYGCAFIDLQQIFGETSVTRGLMTTGAVHPTQNGAGAGGGDGHLLAANSIYAVI